MITMLWRYKGSPEPKGTDNPFVDVTDTSAYYYKAVLWAYENGITNGVDATHFAPGLTVERAMAVAFLYRMTNGSTNGDTQSKFVDVSSGDYYFNAVIWAENNGITKGTDATHFSGEFNCLRGQIVTFLYRTDKLA